MALDFSRNLMRIRYINLNPYRRASLPVKCGSAVTQFKMADKLVAGALLNTGTERNDRNEPE